MKKSDQKKDLGVITSDTPLWNNQIVSCINKRNQIDIRKRDVVAQEIK